MEFLTGPFIVKTSLFAVVFVVFLALAFNRRRAIRADSDARVQAANTLWCAICFFLAFATLYVGGTLAFQAAYDINAKLAEFQGRQMVVSYPYGSAIFGELEKMELSDNHGIGTGNKEINYKLKWAMKIVSAEGCSATYAKCPQTEFRESFNDFKLIPTNDGGAILISIGNVRDTAYRFLPVANPDMSPEHLAWKMKWLDEKASTAEPNLAVGGDQRQREADFVNRPIATQKGDKLNSEVAGATSPEIKELSPPAGGK